MSTSTGNQVVSAGSSTPSVADQVFASSAAASTAPSIAIGFKGALDLMYLYAVALQSLQASAAQRATTLGEVQTEYSKEESDWMEEQTKELDGMQPGNTDDASTNADLNNAIQQKQADIQAGQIKYDNEIAIPQSLAELDQTLSSSIAQALSSFINTSMGSVIRYNSSAAQAVAN